MALNLRLMSALSLALTLPSCVWLLDYDSLQSGPAAGGQASGGETGNPNAGEGVTPGAGQAGAGGASESQCGDCDDKDPCTIDSCDETGAAPTCVHEATEGLKLDGFESSLTADQHLRVSLVAGGQQFFVGSLSVVGSTPKLSLYSLASDGTTLDSLGTDFKLDGQPISNVGLAVEELGLGDIALHGFVATKAKLGDLPAKVFHVESRGGAIMSNLAGASYLEGIPYSFPQALAIDGKIVGAWIQADGTIAVHHVGTTKIDTFGATTLPATSLALLSTSDNQPAVMFTAQAMAKQPLGTYVETAGQNRSKVVECETRAGDYLSSSAISAQIPGVWMANITRAGMGYLNTGGGTLVCAKSSCSVVPEDCAKVTPGNGIRDLAGATVHFDDDDPGIVYSVLALPQLAPKVDDAAAIEGKLSLVLGRADFSDPKNVTNSTIGGDANGLTEVAHNDTSEALKFAGPDWPAVAILPSRQVAVAWIQPNPTAEGTELHVQRYKMCLP